MSGSGVATFCGYIPSIQASSAPGLLDADGGNQVISIGSFGEVRAEVPFAEIGSWQAQPLLSDGGGCFGDLPALESGQYKIRVHQGSRDNWPESEQAIMSSIKSRTPRAANSKLTIKPGIMLGINGKATISIIVNAPFDWKRSAAHPITRKMAW